MGKSSKGFTLVEIMMGLLIITIAFFSLGTIYSSIAKSILASKMKTVATNLAQERIESLKNISYYRLLVTTATTSDSNFPGMSYDIGYYPEENVSVGGNVYYRRIAIEFLKASGSELVGQSWTANDTGIKGITCYVVWKDGDDWKKVVMKNFRNNPNRAELDYTFTGVVSSGTTGNSIENALVQTAQNPSFSARTDANGIYSFKVQAGSYTLQASATGYFTEVSTNYVVSSGQTGGSNHNFSLNLMGLGQTTGYAYIQNHLVITQVVSSTDSGGMSNQEWVELYNPTTYNILIASRSSPSSNFNLFFVTVTWIDSNDAEPGPGNNGKYLVGMPGITGSVFTAFRSTSPHWNVNTTTISVPSNQYFLVANQSTITFTTPSGNVKRVADAYYNGERLDNSGSGGIRITGNRGFPQNGRSDWHDGVGWKSGGSDNSPTLAREGSLGLDLSADSGLGSGKTIIRAAFKSSDSYDPGTITLARRNTSPLGANSFDRNKSGLNSSSGGDWISAPLNQFLITSSGVLNSDFSMLPYSGTPAEGASVSSNDGFSQISYVQSYGSFTILNITTGSWSITITSGNYMRDISFVSITPGLSTSVPNGATDPSWQFSSLSPPWGSILLTTSTLYGYISGTVNNAFNQPLSGVTMSASGATSVTTNSQGLYRLSIIPPGTQLSVNATKTGFSTEVSDPIGVTLGVNISTVNFTLVSAGTVKGFVTTNGSPSGALPGIPIVATDLSSSTTYGSSITGSDGTFTIVSVPTGSVLVVPQLESGETSSPGSSTINVTTVSTGTWSSTFTVTNAYGYIKGMVTSGSSNITTGVLIVASTTPITSDTPPTADSDLRGGGAIYYSGSSDAGGGYSVSLRGGASYYIYGWYPTTLNVDVSSAPKRSVTSPSTVHYVSPGGTTNRNISW